MQSVTVLVVSPNKDLPLPLLDKDLPLPLLNSIRGQEILSQLCAIAGSGSSQNVTFDTESVQRRESRDIFDYSKSLVDEHLEKAWHMRLDQNAARDDYQLFIKTKFDQLSPDEKIARESWIEQNHEIFVTEVILYIWDQACRHFDASFRQDQHDRSEFTRKKYLEMNVSLLAVAILPYDHPLVYKKVPNLAVCNKVFGCSRLWKYHYLLGNIARDFVAAILSSLCSKKKATELLQHRKFCKTKENARTKLREFLLSPSCENNQWLCEQWAVFENVKEQARTAGVCV